MGMRYLKVNEYKTVALVEERGKAAYVVKTFKGQKPEDSRRNAIHTFKSLQLLNSEFADAVHSPRVHSVNEDECSVFMEYLPDLPNARHLTIRDMARVADFFATCYDLKSDVSHLGSIKSSKHLTRKVSALINRGFELRLGFKGDLYENLRLNDGKLFLADSETTSLEPMGLSELVLYIYLTASIRSLLTLRNLDLESIRPVVFSYLTERQSKGLICAALEFAENLMQGLPRPVRATKLRLAANSLDKLYGL